MVQYLVFHVQNKTGEKSMESITHFEFCVPFYFTANGFWNYNFCYQSENAMVIFLKHTDLKGVVTCMVVLIGMYSSFINMESVKGRTVMSYSRRE